MNEPILPQVTEAAQSLKLTLHQFGVRGPAEFEGAFAAMAAQRVGGLVVFDDAVLLSNLQWLPHAWRLAARTPAFVRVVRFRHRRRPDGLRGQFPDMFRRAATFVDKIMKGARVSDLPVERSTKFETIINLKTAKTLGLTVPPSLLTRADEVIE